MKTALVSSLRREKMAETTIHNLKAEINHANCLVCIVLTKKLVSEFDFLKPDNDFAIRDISTQKFFWGNCVSRQK